MSQSLGRQIAGVCGALLLVLGASVNGAAQKSYTKANADFFAELGSPGGASKVGQVNDDPPLVVGLPPQNQE